MPVSWAYADETRPPIFIKAISPGYTVDGVSNVGEFIELARSNSDSTPLSLAGFSIGYTNSSGNTTTLFEFPNYSWMTGESILLRLASSPDSELADLKYTKTLAFKAGPLTIMKDGEIIDSVCWNNQEGCAKEFKSASPTVLVRDLADFTFSHQNIAEYQPFFDPSTPNYYEESASPSSDENPPRQCQNVEFSEILSYYETSASEQFIEFHNPTAEQILLDGCQLKYKNKFYLLSGILIPDGYLAYYPTDFALTKNPTNSNLLELIDTDGSVATNLTYYGGQRKATSYAKIGYDASGAALWHTTYAPTPGAPNNYQEFKTCEAGKVINAETGNCVKATEITETVCPAGKYLNPDTGRCKSYETETEKTCAEGYYLNPATGRCKKIVDNDGAEHPLAAEAYEEASSFVALYAALIIAALGLAYVIFQFRHEIAKFLKRLFDKVFRRAH